MTHQQIQVLEKKKEERQERILGELIKVFSEDSASAVYFNTVDVQDIDTSLQTSLDGSLLGSIHDKYPNVLFFDASWDLIRSSKWYVKLVTECLGVDESEVLGRFTGRFNEMHCEKRGIVYKPEIEAGQYNPYKKILTARQSSSRRMKSLSYLGKSSNKKLSLIQNVLTTPEKISTMLFNDPNGKKKLHKIITLFIKKFEVFLQGHAKVSKDFQAGFWLNEHPWSSKKPLKDHLHGHLYYPNVLVNKKTQKIVRFRPFFSKGQIEMMKVLWKESIKQVIGDHEDLNKEIDIHHEYRSEKAQQLHLLKYCTRSWLSDLGVFFNENNENEDSLMFSKDYNHMKKQFSRFKEWGSIENRTYTFGFLSNTKKIFEAYNIYSEFEDDKNKFCPVCGYKHTHTEKINGFPKIPKLAIIMAVKSKYRIIGVFERRDTEQ